VEPDLKLQKIGIHLQLYCVHIFDIMYFLNQRSLKLQLLAWEGGGAIFIFKFKRESSFSERLETTGLGQGWKLFLGLNQDKGWGAYCGVARSTTW
jgi:hypothetical protein